MTLSAKETANRWGMTLKEASQTCGNKEDGKPVLNLVTLRNWHKNKNSVFNCAVIGAAVIAKGLESEVLALIDSKNAGDK